MACRDVVVGQIVLIRFRSGSPAPRRGSARAGLLGFPGCSAPTPGREKGQPAQAADGSAGIGGNGLAAAV